MLYRGLTIRCGGSQTCWLQWPSKPSAENFPNVTIRFAPSEQSKSQQHGEVSNKQTESEGWTQKCGFINKSPVDRPLVKKYAPQVESSLKITPGILREKRGGKQSLDGNDSEQVTESRCEASSSEGNYEDPRKMQKNRHLDRKRCTANARNQKPQFGGLESTSPVEKDSCIIEPMFQCQHRQSHKKHSPAIVEQTKHKNRVQPFAERQQHDNPIWNIASFTIDCTSYNQDQDVQNTINMLYTSNIASCVREVIQKLMYPDVASGIPN